MITICIHKSCATRHRMTRRTHMSAAERQMAQVLHAEKRQKKTEQREAATYEMAIARAIKESLETSEAYEKADEMRTCTICGEVKDEDNGACPVTAQRVIQSWDAESSYPVRKFVRSCTVLTCGMCVPCAQKLLGREIRMEEASSFDAYRRRCPSCLVRFDRLYDHGRKRVVRPSWA